MRAFLMQEDRDFDLQGELPRLERALTQDLELEVLLHAMADNDPFLHSVARKAILSGLHNDAETILYRQEILKDCLRHPTAVRQLYSFAVEALERKKQYRIGFMDTYPSGILRRSIEAMQMFLEVLRKVRGVAEAHAGRFSSRGFTALVATLQEELSDTYFALVQEHLKELRFDAGVLLSAELGEGNKDINHVLRRLPGREPNWLRRLLRPGPPAHTFRIAERDEAGAKALSELRNRGINLAAHALAQSTDHILSFFDMLCAELGFYVGCLNLSDKLASMNAPFSFPAPAGAGSRKLHFRGLYDVSLALAMGKRVVGNELDADGKDLVIITGPNQGGKSIYLRGIGLAQMMMQCGMFVPAESFSAELCTGLFTHYKREEDATMRGGKLDEELSRMNEIVDCIRPNSILLLNESFASTNEREGSEIAKQIVSALLESGIKVVFVTHLYEFAHELFASKPREACFLRAERRDDGTRTFKLIDGEPLETSFGKDLFEITFGS